MQFFDCVLPPLLFRQSHLSGLLSVSRFVDPVEEVSIERRAYDAHCQETEIDSMTDVVVTVEFLGVYAVQSGKKQRSSQPTSPRTIYEYVRVSTQSSLGSNEAAKIADADLEGHSDGSFRLSSKVDREPGDDGGQCTVRASSNEEETKVSDSAGWVGNLNDKADDAEDLVDEEEEEPLLPSIGENRGYEDPDTCKDVDWHRKKLDLRSRVLSKGVDDGRKEEGDTVEWSDDRDVEEGRQPDLPVDETGADKLPVGSSMLACARSVGRFAPDCPLSLLIVQEACRLRIVVQEEVRYRAHEGREDAFQDENPSKSVRRTRSFRSQPIKYSDRERSPNLLRV